MIRLGDTFSNHGEQIKCYHIITYHILLYHIIWYHRDKNENKETEQLQETRWFRCALKSPAVLKPQMYTKEQKSEEASPTLRSGNTSGIVLPAPKTLF